MDKTLVAFVLDETGSMGHIADDTIGGVNTYFETLKKETPEALVSLMEFSDMSASEPTFRSVCSGVKVTDVPELTDENYRPRGNTPLLDAIGKAITETEKIEADRYLLVIMTDGYENASKEWTYEGVRKKMKKIEKTDKWTIVFLGSTRESLEQFTRMGGQHTNSMQYARSGMSGQAVGQTMSSVAYASTERMRSPDTKSDTFFQDAGQTEADYDDPDADTSVTK